MFDLNRQPSEHLQKRLQKDAELLDTIKGKLLELERLHAAFQGMYEDGVYRFYHHSFKVYQLQDFTLKAIEAFREIGKATDNELCAWLRQIVDAGTGKEWEPDHNRNWLLHTRPIVEAFLHAKYFLEMMIKCGRELDSAPTVLPFGWAAILELYNQR
jgi:hypothetical protein